MEVLSVVWFASAIVGGCAALTAVFSRRWRSAALIVAVVSFAVAGVLGILSIGVLFLAASVGCLVIAVNSRDAAPRSSG